MKCTTNYRRDNNELLLSNNETTKTLINNDLCFQGGRGPEHYGVCSNFLKDIKKGDKIECFVRK